MLPNHITWVDRISFLRWATPFAVACVGIGYMLFDHAVLDVRPVASPYTVLSVIFFGIVGPAVAWLTLTWAVKSAQAEVEAQAETRRQIEVLRAIHQTSLELTSRLDSKQVLSAIMEQAERLLHAAGSSISVREPHTDLIRSIAIHNLPPEYYDVVIRLPEGVAGQVISTGKPLIVNDYRHWPGRSPTFESSPQDAVVGVPLRWHGEVFGVLNVLDQGERRPFNDDDVQVLSLFADLASIALKNAELYAEIFSLTENLEDEVLARTNELNQAREALAQQAAQLQKLLAITVHIQEEERSRIARDLHDGSNQLITGALYEIQAARESLVRQRSETALEKLDTAKSLLANIEAVNRRIIFDLRPPVLDAQGLIPAIKWYANIFYTHYGIECLVQVSGQPRRLAPHVETAIFRIVQESLNNVAEHAQADCTRVRVRFGPVKLGILIEDAGIGFDHESAEMSSAGRMGLIGMRERAKTIGAQVKVMSLPGHGTRVAFELALPDLRPQPATQPSNGVPLELPSNGRH